MITRRELLRRAGLAGLAATPLVALAKITPKQPAKPVTPVKLKPISLDGSEISINGQIVGNITNIEMISRSEQTIDVTNLDSSSRQYFHDYGEIKVTSLNHGDGLFIMRDAFNAGEPVNVAMIMGGMEYKFEAYIMSFAVSANYNDLIKHETTMRIVGTILIM